MNTSLQEEVPKVCVVITEYRYNSHAEVIVGRLLGQFDYNPRVQVVSMYVDQFPYNDMSRDEAARCGIPICATIGDAIVEAHRHGLGGVIIIGEHGNYPTNEKGQKCYPRRRFVEETLRALDELGIRVPIFADKHISWNKEDSQWMYQAITDRGITFLGGSSIPFVPKKPEVDGSSPYLPLEMLVISFGGTEDYGYHALEVLQSMAEKREGGEVGVISVRAISGIQVWEEMERGDWPEDLMHAALLTYAKPKSEHPMTRNPVPVLITVEYLDGLKGYVLQLPEEVEQWSLAWRSMEGITAVRYDSDLNRPFSHFERLTKWIETMMICGHSPVPIERTLLTTGVINYAMESLYCGKVMQTSDLRIKYHFKGEIQLDEDDELGETIYG